MENLLPKDFISEYNHSNYIDEEDGKKFFHMDCSGFIYWLLLRSGYKRALVELRKFLKENNFIKINRFFCKDFTFIYEHKKDFEYWQFIEQPIKDSILVVVFPDGNGHCMFVDEIIENKENKIALRIMDSTRYPHKNDTRKDTGIGLGEIEITQKNNDWFYDSNNPELPTRKAEIYFVLPKK